MRYIEVRDVTFAYDETPVLEHISYDLNSGEFVTLTGENGAAKSTLVRIMLKLLTPQQGSIWYAAKNIDGTPLTMGYLPQQIASFDVGFPSTVYELVASGRYPRGRWFKRLTAFDHECITQALHSVEMWDFRDRKIGDLSGGQKQRVCMARLFASNPDIFVLDEPTTGMDERSRQQFYQLLHHQAQDHHKTVFMITHDHDEVKQYIDRNIRLVRKESCQWRCFHMSS